MRGFQTLAGSTLAQEIDDAGTSVPRLPCRVMRGMAEAYELGAVFG